MGTKLTRTPEEFAHAIRAIRPTHGDALDYLAQRIQRLKRNYSPRLPELQAVLHEMTAHPEKYK